MFQKITDMWPDLLRQFQGQESDEEDPDNEVPETEPEQNHEIEESFKNLRWTRVIALSDYKEASAQVFSMSDDIIYGQQ